MKTVYREKEERLLYNKLRENKDRIPKPPRDDMMELMTTAYSECNVNQAVSYKVNWLTNKLDGSEDMVVSQSLRDLVGQEMMEFRAELLKSQVPATLREAVQQITRPEGVRPKDTGQRDTLYIQEDEGAELFDGDGTDIPADVDVDDEITASDEEDDTSVVTGKVQEEMEGDKNSDSCKNQSESAAAADSPMFSDSLTSKLKILQEFSDLIRQKRLSLNSTVAGGTMIAVFNTIQTTISNGRKKLLVKFGDPYLTTPHTIDRTED